MPPALRSFAFGLIAAATAFAAVPDAIANCNLIPYIPRRFESSTAGMPTAFVSRPIAETGDVVLVWLDRVWRSNHTFTLPF